VAVKRATAAGEKSPGAYISLVERYRAQQCSGRLRPTASRRARTESLVARRKPSQRTTAAGENPPVASESLMAQRKASRSHGRENKRSSFRGKSPLRSGRAPHGGILHGARRLATRASQFCGRAAKRRGGRHLGRLLAWVASLKAPHCTVSDEKLEDGRPQNTQVPPKTKGNGAAPAHTRSEVRQKWLRDNLAAEVVKPRTEFAVNRLYLGSTCQKCISQSFRCTERALLAFHLHSPHLHRIKVG
jgi:hypothetical protein